MLDIMTNTPFNVMVVGMTACGKTKYLLNMLEKEKDVSRMEV